MGQRGHDAVKLRVVDDVLGGIRRQNIVDGDGIETLGHAREICDAEFSATPSLRGGGDKDHTGNLPFGTILTPETHTILTGAVAAMLQMQFHQPGTKGRSPLLDRLIVHPLVCAECFSVIVVWAPSKTVVFRNAVDG